MLHRVLTDVALVGIALALGLAAGQVGVPARYQRNGLLVLAGLALAAGLIAAVWAVAVSW